MSIVPFQSIEDPLFQFSCPLPLIFEAVTEAPTVLSDRIDMQGSRDAVLKKCGKIVYPV